MSDAQLTPEVFATWQTPRQVLNALPIAWNFETKAGEIASRLKSGVIFAAADTLINGSDRKYFTILSPRIWNDWAYLADDGSAMAFWDAGRREASTGSVAFGIRLQPETVANLVAFAHLTEGSATPAATIKSIPTAMNATSGLVDLDALPSRGGRPVAGFWEDLIVEIARRMHLGDFKPATQADVERAMADWIQEKGFKGGETQVKERARKVFKAFR